MMHGTIFVVDDDEAVRDSMALLIRASGFAVQTFATGTEFLSACDGQPRGCAVIDVHMPGMDGFGVVEALRARNAAMDVILITGRFDAATQTRARGLGVDLVLRKPLARGLLIRTLHAVLSPEIKG